MDLNETHCLPVKDCTAYFNRRRTRSTHHTTEYMPCFFHDFVCQAVALKNIYAATGKCLFRTMSRQYYAMSRHRTFLTAVKTANRRKTQAAFSQALTLTGSLVSQKVILMRGCVTNKPSSPSISNAFSFNRFSWKNCDLDTQFEIPDVSRSTLGVSW